jgi:branched-subunit amino acid aminotransferase/4-amino-4-deoxychorismate lyase
MLIKHVIARRSETTTKQSPESGGLLRSLPLTRNDILITARHGILLGVTRRAVLRLARGQGMQVEYRAPHVAPREEFDEAFITSSSRGVVPIVMIDGTPVGEGGVGAWTKRLGVAYQAYVEKRSEKISG